jgi:hypothetical protein
VKEKEEKRKREKIILVGLFSFAWKKRERE